MRFDILGLMQNDMVTKALGEAKASNMESAFAGTVVKNVVNNMDSYRNTAKLEEACTALGASVFALSPDNPFELTALQRVSAEQALKASAFTVYEILRNVFTHDNAVEKMFKKDGDMEGVTDPNLIMQAIVAHYAEQASKRSPFFVTYDDDDDRRFNTQSGGAGVAMVIDLVNKKVAPIEGMQQATVGDLVINVNATRDKLSLTGMPGQDANEVTIIVGDTRNGLFSNVTSASGKSLMCPRWPNSRYGELNSKGKLIPRESLTMDDIISDSFIMPSSWDLSQIGDDQRDFNILSYLRTRYGYKVDKANPFNATRRQLHERITSLTNDPGSDLFIPPAFMQNMVYREEGGNKIPCLAITQIKSVYDPKASNIIGIEGADVIQKTWEREVLLFNEQHGGEGVSKVLDLDNKPTGDGEQKFPISRESCQVGSGNRYKCGVCGKEVKKNALKQHKPKKLPDGMARDYPGVADSVKYEDSWMCGTCCDSLLKQRESAVKAFSTTKQEADKAKAEEEKLLAEGIAAEAEVTKAKDDLEAQNLAIETLKDLGKEVPKVLLDHKETLVFNLQEAETKFHAIEVRMKGAGNKATALNNGAAIALPPAPKAASGTNLGEAISKATANKAAVISRPATKNNKKPNRHERRAAAAQIKGK